MADLNAIANEFIREEISEFITRPDEIERITNLYAAAHPSMQDIAAALIDGDDDLVDELSAKALENGHEALEIMDFGLIAGMASSSARTSSLCRRCCPAPGR
jgi:methanogenic corrinoid protein MtbC1